MAAVKDGALSIHRLKRLLEDSHAREITTLKMEIQQIMKGILIIIGSILASANNNLLYRKLQLFHAKGNFRTAGIGGQHHAWSCQLRERNGCSWRY